MSEHFATNSSSSETEPSAIPYRNASHQFQANTLGMWTFLATEVMLFGGLFASYSVYRVLYPDAFATGSQHLDIRLGSLNTIVLLTSSLTMALALLANQQRKRLSFCSWISLTMLLGIIFLVIKGTEYQHVYREHLISFESSSFQTPQLGTPLELFLLCYFFLTSLHVLHLVIGIGLLAGLFFLSARSKITDCTIELFGSRRSSFAVEMVGLYWHFVDVVWIFLFPLLYLIRRSS